MDTSLLATDILDRLEIQEVLTGIYDRAIAQRVIETVIEEFKAVSELVEDDFDDDSNSDNVEDCRSSESMEL